MQMGKKGLKNLMKEAQRVQQKLEMEMETQRIEASSGGGVVTVVLDGSKRLQSIRIDPEAVDPEDVDMLQDLIVAAVNEAGRKVDEVLSSQLGGLTGGLLGGS
jgi:DNA-binding YbaB/EbfC family protein